MRILDTNPVLVEMAAKATTERVRVAAREAEIRSELERRERDAERKRRERAMNRTLGRRADGSTIRPIGQIERAARAIYAKDIVAAEVAALVAIRYGK